MAQETFKLELDNVSVDVSVTINDTSAAPLAGAESFTDTGTSSWTVPNGVTSISAVAVGAGGGGFGYWNYDANTIRTMTSGAGGDLRWVEDVTVTPGETLTVTVGAKGDKASVSGGAYGNYTNNSTAGGSSSIARDTTILLRGKGGSASGQTNSDSNVGDGGAIGGGMQSGQIMSHYGGAGGGGASGYQGDGTTGAPGGGSQYNWYYAGTPQGGSASGGDGGFGKSSSGAGGGGVGILSQGSSAAKQSGRGGSGGSNASGSTGGAYGGGGAGGRYPGDGAQGAVRIIWGGSQYPFPT